MPEIPEPQAISIDLSKLADIRGSRQSAAEYEAAGFHDHEIRTHSSCTTMNGTWEDGYVLLHTNPYVHHQAAQAVSSPIGDENDEVRDVRTSCRKMSHSTKFGSEGDNFAVSKVYWRQYACTALQLLV